MHLAKGRIKHICKLLLWSRKRQLLAHCLLPHMPLVPDHCGAMDGGVLSAGARLENYSLSQKTRCALQGFSADCCSGVTHGCLILFLSL